MKTKAIKCIIALIIIAACVFAGISITNYGNTVMVKEYNLNWNIAYVTIIGSALFLVIGFSTGFIIRTLARIPEQRIVFGIALGLTVLCGLFMVLLGLDWITDNGISFGMGQFVLGTLGYWFLLFLLYGARYVFAVFGLLLIMFLPGRKEKTLALPK